MSNRRGIERRPGGQDQQEVFSTDELDQEELDEKSGRPMPGTSSFVGDGRSRRGGETEGIYFASVTALVPVRKQLENYQANLANSRGQDESRDVPIYTNWILERSEVDANGNALGFNTLAEGRRRRGRGDESSSRSFRMGDRNSETMHHDFRHPLLTSDVPPVEVRDPDRLFVHDKIASLSEKQYQKEKAQKASRRRRRDGRGDQRQDYGSDRARIGDSRFGELREQQFSDRQLPMEDGRSSSGREMGRESVPQTGLRSTMPLDEAPEFYMFRYVDRSVEVGRTYRYRLQLYLDDPNNSRYNKPSPETLEPAVAERVMSANSSSRATDFSAESPPVKILPGQQVLLAKANPAPQTVIRETGQSFQKPGAFPSAEVMALIFDATRSTSIPGTVQVSPGAAVCFNADAEIPLWSRSWLKKEKNFKFRTDFDVLDVRGGDEVDKIKVITKPGEMLVRDPQGRIKVIRELADQELVAEYTFAKEEPASRREGGLDGGRGGDARDGRFEGGGREGGRGARSRGREGSSPR